MMNKTTLIFILSIAMCLPAKADTLLGLYVGAQGWNTESSGGFAQNEVLANFDFEDQTNTHFYAALEHPIPLVPNIKIARTTRDNEGLTVLDGTFTFGGEVYAVSSRLQTTADLTTTDLTVYYELLDNDVVSFDVGLNGMLIEGDILVVDTDTQQSSQENLSVVVPLIYSRLALGLPLTGLGVYVEGSFISIDDNSVSDYQAAITYNFIESLAIDMTFQAGYRATTIDIEDIDDVYADLEFKGPFVGVQLHF